MSGILEAGSGNQALTSSHFTFSPATWQTSIQGDITGRDKTGRPRQMNTQQQQRQSTARSTENNYPPSTRVLPQNRKEGKRWKHTMRGNWGSRGMAQIIPNYGNRLRYVVKFTCRPPYPWERTMVPINRSLGGPQKDVLEKRKVVYPWRGWHPSTTSP